MTEKVKRPLEWLLKAPDEKNLAKLLTNAELSAIGTDVVQSYELDRQARGSWDQQSEDAMKLAKQVREPKTTPWIDCSNVKHPLITVASIQFAARAYPEIVRGDRIVKCQITGDDIQPPQVQPPALAQPGGGPAAGMIEGGPALPASNPDIVAPAAGPAQASPGPSMVANPAAAAQAVQVLQQQVQQAQQVAEQEKQKLSKRARADRIQTHMNFQLTQEMPEWDAETDRLLHILPILGQCFRKTYRSARLRRNVSKLVLPDDCVVNARARSLEEARRITHRIWFYENDVWEKVRNGTWLEIKNLGPSLEAMTSSDKDAPHEFLEQHCYIDLDGDDYREPYIVTVHKATAQVVRISARWNPDTGIEVAEYKGGTRVARIEPDHYFTHFPFIPNPDGSLNALGFGQLLEPINASVNTVLNQLIDAGSLANAGGGFIGRGVRLRGGVWSFKPGEWKFVDAPGGALRDNLVPLPAKEPSLVLFQLLGFLVNAGKEITSVQDVLTGDAKLAGTMPVGTIMALVEQGLKVFTAIYKRVYRSLTEEFKKLYKLNARFLDEQFPFWLIGHPEKYTVGAKDYLEADLTVVPVADPNLSSDMQRLLKAQALKELSGRPGIDEVEVTRRLVTAIHPEDMSSVLLTDDQIAGRVPIKWKPPPPPQMVTAQAKAQRLLQQAQEAQVRLQMDISKFNLEIESLVADIAKKKADTVLALAKAEAAEAGPQMDKYRAELSLIESQIKHQVDLVKQGMQAHGRMIGQIEQATRTPEPGPAGVTPRQEGGPVAAGKPFLVGEGGPEVFVPDKGTGGGDLGPWNPAIASGAGYKSWKEKRAAQLSGLDPDYNIDGWYPTPGEGPLNKPEQWMYVDIPALKKSDWYDKDTIKSFAAAAKKHGVDPLTYIALGISETGLGNDNPANPAMISPQAHGPAMAKLYGEEWWERPDIHSIDYGARYLAEKMKQYKDDKLSGIQAYSGTGKTIYKGMKGDPRYPKISGEERYFGKKVKDVDFWKDKPQAKRVLAIESALKRNKEFMDYIRSLQVVPKEEPRQEGGPVTAGKSYLVGEVGPETVIPFTKDPLYDYESAAEYGITMDPVTKHWPSRVPQTGLILKSEKHPTFYKTIEGEKEAGFVMYRAPSGRIYSFPADSVVPEGFIPFVPGQD